MFLAAKVSPQLTKIKSNLFGSSNCVDGTFCHQAVVGLGGNLGDVKRRFSHLFYHLRKEKRVRVVAVTTILKNPPFGYLKQPDFYNALMVVRTNLGAKMLLRYLLGVERKFGRKRSFKDAPRSLDLDIIFFDNLHVTTPRLTIPHPSWHKRASVILPMMELV